MTESPQIRTEIDGRALKIVVAAGEHTTAGLDMPKFFGPTGRAARAAHPKVRYTAGKVAGRVRLLRRFAPAGLVDAGLRRDLQLDAVPTAPARTHLLAMRSERP